MSEVEIKRSWTLSFESDRRLIVGVSREITRPRQWWRWTLEWLVEVRDVWLGVYWDRKPGQLDVYVCVLPMLPIHFRYESADWPPYRCRGCGRDEWETMTQYTPADYWCCNVCGRRKPLPHEDAARLLAQHSEASS